MLSVNNLTAVHKDTGYTLFSNLSFSVQKGDKLAVIGAEGNGKTSLLEIICRPDEAMHWLTWSGSVTYHPWKMGYLPQACPPSLLRKTAAEWMLPLAGDADLYRLAAEFRLSTDVLFAQRTLATLSGGERTKLCLIRLLVHPPDLLVLDEPTNDLDLESIITLENFIQNSQAALLYISHDETLLDRTANRILHLEQIWRRTTSRVTLSGLGFRDYMEAFTSSIARQNQQAAKEEEFYQEKLKRYRRIESRVEHEQAVISRQDPGGARLLKKKMHEVKSLGRRFEREHARQTQRTDREDEVNFFLEDLPGVPAGREILRLFLPELHIGDRVLSRNVRLDITGSEHMAITGANGSGKTTLLRTIQRIIETQRGLRTFYLPQNANELFENDMPAIDFLAPDGKTSSKEAASALLGSLRFSRDEMTSLTSTLSGGQKIKLAFAKLRLTRPNVLLLDEPSRHLSPLSNPAFRASVAAFKGCVISVSHDRAFLAEVCTRVLRLTPDGLVDEDPALYQR